jgi:hypothetical protein
VRSWRAPLTAIYGPITVTAAWDLGGLGPSQSETAVFPWRWHYHMAGFAGFTGWLLIVALLALLKENHKLQAWTIWIPFLLTSELIVPLLAHFCAGLSCWGPVHGLLLTILPSGACNFLHNYFVSGSGDDTIALAFQWLLVLWAVVWLLGARFARRRPIVGILLVLALAVAVGVSGHLWLRYGAPPSRAGHYRFYLAPELPVIYLISVVGFFLGAAAAGALAYRIHHRARFRTLFPLTLLLGVAASLVCGYLITMFAPGRRGAAPPLEAALFGIVLLAPCFAAILYAMNLPFLILAAKCPLYHDRYRRLLRLPAAQPPFANPPPETSLGETCALT